MKELSDLLGQRKEARNPISYCPHSVASIRVRRYTYPSSPRLRWWIDVCYFSSNDIYVIGTIETNLGDSAASMKETSESLKLGLDVICPVPSKIVAYMKKYCGSVTLPIENNVESPNFLFSSTDPFGGGPFQPIVYLESDDEGIYE